MHTHDAPFTWWMYARHLTFRTLVVALACICAFLIPNLTILLTLVGAILGTIISIIIPVLFYNRAYQYPESHYRLRNKAEPPQENKAEGGEEEEQPLIEE